MTWQSKCNIRQVLNRAVLLVLALSVTACSTVRLGYGWLPTAFNWRLSSYVTLDDDQQTRVDKHLNSLLEWHRAAELPRYAAFLESVLTHPAVLAATDSRVQPTALSSQQSVSVQVLKAWRIEAMMFWPALADRLAGPIADMALTFTPEQYADIRAEVRSRQDERRAEHVEAPLEQRLRHRFERWEKRVSGMLGGLSEAQRDLLVSRLPQMTDSAPWWQARNAWQNRFVDLLATLAAEQTPYPLARQRIRDAMESWVHPGGQREQTLRDTMRTEAELLVVDLLALATPDQWRALRAYGESLITDFRALADFPRS